MSVYAHLPATLPCASAQKVKLFCLRVIHAIWPFPSADLALGAWECMGLYWVYTPFWSFAAHIRACNGFHVLLHKLIHQQFLFSKFEAFFTISSFITENTVDVQMFLCLRCIPYTEYGNVSCLSLCIASLIILTAKVCRCGTVGCLDTVTSSFHPQR